MAKLSSIIVPSVLVALASMAVPASAADLHRPAPFGASAQYVGHGQTVNLQRDIAKLDARIGRALATRQISPREATGLRRDVRNLQRLFAQSQRKGLTRYEARTIESRLAQVNGALRAERRDRDNRRG